MKFKNTSKARRAHKSLNTGLAKNEFTLNNLPKCPYCGGKMRIVKAKEADADVTYLECVNNDAMHDVRGKVTPSNDKFRFLSTPADKKLRYLRQEAHFYMNLCIRNEIFKSKSDAYAYLNTNCILGSGRRETTALDTGDGNSIASLGTGRITHIGHMREFGCQEVIKECVDLLYKNADRLTYITRHGNPHYEPEDIKIKLDELMDIRWQRDNK